MSGRRNQQYNQGSSSSWNDDRRRGGSHSGSVRSSNLSAKQWEREKGALGTRTRTNIWIPGPHHVYPEELDEIGSKNAVRRVRGWITTWVDQAEKRLQQCVWVTPNQAGGVFIRQRLEEHFQTLRSYGVPFCAGEDFGDDPMEEEQWMFVIGSCALCGSFDHLDLPLGPCPNGTIHANIKISLGSRRSVAWQ